MGSPLLPLPPELARKAEQELNEVPAERLERIRTFREAVLSVPGLKSRTDDAFLLRFLRARKFNQDRALDVLKSYYKQRIKYPLFYKNLLTSNIQNCLESNIIGLLPGKDAEGRTTWFSNLGNHWDPSTVPLEDIIRNILLGSELMIQEDSAQVNGYVIIVNLEGFGLRHVPAFNPFKMYLLFSVTLNSFPVRYKKFHFINTPAIFSVVFAMFRPFLTRKMKERFVFHSGNLSLEQESIPPEICPEDLGGTLSAEEFSSWNSEWKRRLTENDAQIIKDQKFGFEKP